MRSFFLIAISVSLFVSMSVSYASNLSNGEKDLRYRDIYFSYYSKDYFLAITRALAEMEMRRVDDKHEELNLLLGVLYAGYGLYSDAEDYLSLMASSATDRKKLNAARFYLARTYYKDGHYKKAWNQLSRIEGDVPDKIRGELDYLKIVLLLKSGDLKQTEGIYHEIKKDDYWYSYASYNLGAAYIRNGDLKTGVSMLQSLGAKEYVSDELLSLVDKANTALGYYFLDRQQSVQAVSYFQKVRLQGAFSNKAMLGLGWAYSQQEDFDRALVPWINLSRKGIDDVTVQEGILASSFALQRVHALQQALDNYENAISIYELLKENIAQTIVKVRQGEVSAALFSDEDLSDAAISDRLLTILQKEQGALLGKVLQEESFQKAFREYRDLRYLENKLELWKRQLKPFQTAKFGSAKEEKPFEAKRSALDARSMYQRVIAREQRLNSLLKDYEQGIQQKLVASLDKQNLFVANYLSQARFAVAQILDSQAVK